MCKKICFALVVLLPVIFVLLGYYLTYVDTTLAGSYPIITPAEDRRFDIDHLKEGTVIQGKTFLITGANSGLGFESAKMLLEKGGRVVLACRTVKKCQEAVTEMGLKDAEKAVVLDVPLDLGSLESVQKYVKGYKASGLPLDVLLLNAGIMAVPYGLTKDGIESQIGINHFAHATLTFGLLDTLLKSKFNPRIVAVSSFGHNFADDVFQSLDEYNDEKKYDSYVAYGRSKLANYFFCHELQKKVDAKYPSKKVFINAIHPGGVKSNLAKGAGQDQFLIDLMDKMNWDARTGAFTQVGAAVDPSVEEKNIKGSYFTPIFKENRASLSALAQNEEKSAQFWDFTVKVLKSFGVEATV